MFLSFIISWIIIIVWIGFMFRQQPSFEQHHHRVKKHRKLVTLLPYYDVHMMKYDNKNHSEYNVDDTNEDYHNHRSNSNLLHEKKSNNNRSSRSNNHNRQQTVVRDNNNNNAIDNTVKQIPTNSQLPYGYLPSSSSSSKIMMKTISTTSNHNNNQQQQHYNNEKITTTIRSNNVDSFTKTNNDSDYESTKISLTASTILKFNIDYNDTIIPNQFESDHYIFCSIVDDINNPNNNPTTTSMNPNRSLCQSSFPRWESICYNNNNNNNNTIIMTTMIYYIIQLGSNLNSITNPLTHKDLYIYTNDHIYDINGWFPNNLYLLTNNNNNNIIIYTSYKTQLFHIKATHAKEQKIILHEILMKNSIKQLLSYITTSATDYDSNNHNNEGTNNSEKIKKQKQLYAQQRWKRLYELLIVDMNDKNDDDVVTNSNMIRSIPFIMWHGDYTGCNLNNWDDRNSNNKLSSIPLFTVAANVNCLCTIPFPNYQIYIDSKHNSNEWKDIQDQYKKLYPKWTNKKSQIIWRGSLTGINPKRNINGMRYQFFQYIYTNITQSERDTYMNIHITSIPYHPERVSVIDYVNMTLLLDVLGP